MVTERQSLVTVVILGLSAPTPRAGVRAYSYSKSKTEKFRALCAQGKERNYVGVLICEM